MKKDTPPRAFEAAFPGLLWKDQVPGTQMAATAYASKAIEIDALPDPGPVVPPGGLPARTACGPIFHGESGHELVVESKQIVFDPSMQGADGIRITGSWNKVTVRNCGVRGAFDAGINIVPVGNGHIGEIVIEDCETLDTAGQGLYVHECGKLTMRRVVSDNCGADTLLTHACYLQNYAIEPDVQDCIFSRAGSHGIQQRGGGLNKNNLYLFNPINIAMGAGNYPKVGGVPVWCWDNVLIGGGDIGVEPRGMALYFGNVRTGACSNNVLADGTGGGQLPLNLDCDQKGEEGEASFGVQDFKVYGNVRRKWGGAVQIDPGPQTGTTVKGMEERTDLYGVDLSFAALGLTWDAIRSGAVRASGVNAKVRSLLGMGV